MTEDYETLKKQFDEMEQRQWESDPRTQALKALTTSAANMLRDMTMDPAIPHHAKEAMVHRIAELET